MLYRIPLKPPMDIKVREKYIDTVLEIRILKHVL